MRGDGAHRVAVDLGVLVAVEAELLVEIAAVGDARARPNLENLPHPFGSDEPVRLDVAVDVAVLGGLHRQAVALLAGAQRLLDAFVLGDVSHRADPAHHRAGRVAHRHGGKVHPPRLRVAGEPHLDVEARPLAGEVLGDRARQLQTVLGVERNAPHQVVAAVERRVWGEAVDLQQPWRGVDRVGGGSPVPEAIVARLHGACVALLLAQLPGCARASPAHGNPDHGEHDETRQVEEAAEYRVARRDELRQREGAERRGQESRAGTAEPRGANHRENEQPPVRKQRAGRRKMHQHREQDAGGRQRIPQRDCSHHSSSSEAATADNSSLRVRGLGSTFFAPSRRAASADPARPRLERLDRARIGAAYTYSDWISASARRALGASANPSKLFDSTRKRCNRLSRAKAACRGRAIRNFLELTCCYLLPRRVAMPQLEVPKEKRALHVRRPQAWPIPESDAKADCCSPVSAGSVSAE